MSFRVFEPSYDFIDERLNVFLGDRLSSVIAEVEGPLRIALVLYVVLYGVAILRGAISEPVMDFAVRSLKLAFLYLLATTAAYSTFVTEPLFTGLPNALTRAVSGADNRPFDIRRGGGPGKTLATLKTWIAHFVDEPDAIAHAFAPALVDKGHIILAAENGVVAASFKWPEFARIAYAKAPQNRRARSISHGENEMTLDRGLADSVALPDLVNGRLSAPSPLIGKAVAVVGAGAIGSRVCLELARSGAGQSQRPMLIIDGDQFSTANFGRHVLPVSAVRLAKAGALAAEVRRLHPDLTVEGVATDVFGVTARLQDYDLVIDATGSTPVGLRLNDLAVTTRRLGKPFPPVIHAAIHGNGLAAQTVLVRAAISATSASDRSTATG